MLPRFDNERTFAQMASWNSFLHTREATPTRLLRLQSWECRRQFCMQFVHEYALSIEDPIFQCSRQIHTICPVSPLNISLRAMHTLSISPRLAHAMERLYAYVKSFILQCGDLLVRQVNVAPYICSLTYLPAVTTGKLLFFRWSGCLIVLSDEMNQSFSWDANVTSPGHECNVTCHHGTWTMWRGWTNVHRTCFTAAHSYSIFSLCLICF